jgi:type I restriction enzyme S subunit
MKTTKNIPELRFPEFEGEWIEMQLGELTSKIGSGSTPKGGDEIYQSIGIPFIRSQNIIENHLVLDDTCIPLDIHYKMLGSKVCANDVLLNITGASIGRSCVVPEDFTEGNVNQHVSIIRLKKDNSKFLQLFISSSRGQKLIYEGQTGSGREGLNFESIKRFKIHFPPLPEQQKIASFLSAADKRIKLLSQKKEKLEQYKKGIMQLIFSKQLRFKDENGQEYPEWEEKRLGDLTDFIMNGLSLPQNNEGKGVKVTRIETISDRTINIQKVGYVETNQDITRYQLNIGDILFSNINSVAHIGKVVRIDNEYDLFHGMNLLRIKLNRNLCSTRFIYHVLNLESSKKYFEKICNKAVNQASINQTELGKTIIRTPTIQEQQKIASFLSSIDQKITLVNQQIELTRKWKQGLLQKMFV